MVVKQSFTYGNPQRLAKELGRRLKRLRLVRGWSQDELAKRVGIGLSTLKALEGQGKGTLVRFLQVAGALGVLDECVDLFARTRVADSLEAVERLERQRAPRRKKGGQT